MRATALAKKKKELLLSELELTQQLVSACSKELSQQIEGVAVIVTPPSVSVEVN